MRVVAGVQACEAQCKEVLSWRQRGFQSGGPSEAHCRYAMSR